MKNQIKKKTGNHNISPKLNKRNLNNNNNNYNYNKALIQDPIYYLRLKYPNHYFIIESVMKCESPSCSTGGDYLTDEEILSSWNLQQDNILT